MSKSEKSLIGSFVRTHIITSLIGLFSAILTNRYMILDYFILAITVLVYSLCIYTYTWKIGFSYTGRVKSGLERKPSPYKAAIIGLCFMSVPLLTGFLVFFSNQVKIFAFFAVVFNTYSFASLSVFKDNVVLIGLYMIIVNLIFILFGQLGFFLGQKDIMLTKKIMYKNK